MKTSLLINIEHPDDISAEGLIEHAIKPALRDIDSDAGVAYQVIIINNNRERAFRTALSLALSNFPEDWTNDQILEGVEEKSDLVEVWAPFENWEPLDVANYIEELAGAIYATYF